MSTRRGAAAQYTFVASSVALVGVTGPRRGAADIYLDGRYVRTVSAHSPARTDRVVVFQRQWPAGGLHTLRVVSRRASFDIDAVVYN